MYESIPSLRFGLCSLRCSTKENTNPFLDSLESDMNVLGLFLRIVGCTTPNLKLGTIAKGALHSLNSVLQSRTCRVTYVLESSESKRNVLYFSLTYCIISGIML